MTWRSWQLGLAGAMLAAALVGCRDRQDQGPATDRESSEPAVRAPSSSVGAAGPAFRPLDSAIAAVPPPVMSAPAVAPSPAPTGAAAGGSVIRAVEVAGPNVASAPAAGPPTAVSRRDLEELASQAAPSSSPPGESAVPLELDRLLPPAPGQWARYRSSLGGPAAIRKRAFESLGPGPNDYTVVDVMTLGGDAIGLPARSILSRVGRRWPRPMKTDARRVEYDRETISVGSRSLDCTVLTIESRAEGATLVEKEWVSPQAPLGGLVRRLVTTDGREVVREELMDFGP